MRYLWFHLLAHNRLNINVHICAANMHSMKKSNPWGIPPLLGIEIAISDSDWFVGLGVWFSLRVREVPGSNPGRAQSFIFIPLKMRDLEHETKGPHILSWKTEWERKTVTYYTMLTMLCINALEPANKNMAQTLRGIGLTNALKFAVIPLTATLSMVTSLLLIWSYHSMRQWSA